jgi:glycosyltransferase involved in cell wall biosynthesis
MSSNQDLSLSLVITSYTTERLNDIYELLESVKNQTLKNMETIFVVERSLELFEKLKTYSRENRISNLVVVFNDGIPGQSPARNLGVKNATGDIIAFVDDDVLLFTDWAEEMLKTYDDNSIIGVTGPAFPLWEKETMTWLPTELYWITSCTDFARLTRPTAVRTAGGMNMSFRKEAFNYCTFSQDFGHIAKEHKKVGPVVDDAEFSINLRLKTGKTILFNPKVRVKHRVYTYRLSQKFIRGQAYWQGYSKARLWKIYRNDADTRKLMRERTLLRRILFELLPVTTFQLLSEPKIACKKFTLTNKILFYVALGFSAGTFPKLIGFSKRYFMS